MSADARLQEAIARVQRDLHASHETEGITLVPGSGDSASGILLCDVLSGTQVIAWIPVPAGVSVAEMSYQVANEIQDILVGRHVFAAWPKCPDHEHQLLAHLGRTRAAWNCSTTNRAVCEIGRYATSRPPATSRQGS